MSDDLDALMAFAVETATAAGAVIRRHVDRPGIEWKEDGTEVTRADRAAERAIREAIGARYPADGVLGEEEGEEGMGSRRRWTVDPIDGTRSFVCGVPLFGVLLGLEVEGVPLLGCCHFPLLGETLVGARGGGAWLDGVRVRASPCDRLEDARLVTSGLEYWRDWADPELRDGFDRLLGGVRMGRTWGDCYGYALIATGRAEIFVDPRVGRYWDYAPFLPILAEAGARFTSASGGRLTDDLPSLATNGHLHRASLELLAGGEAER